MGGSGGGFFSGRPDPDILRERLRSSEAKAEDQDYATEVAGIIAETLSEFNNRDVEGTNRILERVKSELSEEVEGTVDLRFGGSVAKHTYVDGLSDVDALVLVSRPEAAEKLPEELRKAFGDRLRARFGRDCVEEGQLAVTLHIEDKTIQLLPAYQDRAGFKISSSDGKQWSKIKPRVFAEKLTSVNQKCSGKLVPTIKLAKSIISSLPEQRRLTGYHIESLAIDIFKRYGGDKTPRAMVQHFFKEGQQRVRGPIRDSTGQSVHVDDYLGGSDSLARRVVSDALGRISRRLKNADGAKSIESWKDILGVS